MTHHPSSSTTFETSRCEVRVIGRGRTRLVHACGELDLLSAHLLEGATAAGAVDVDLDLSEVSFLDAAGIRAILAASERCAGAGGRLRVIDLRPFHRSLLERLGLGTLLSTHLRPRQAPDSGP